MWWGQQATLFAGPDLLVMEYVQGSTLSSLVAQGGTYFETSAEICEVKKIFSLSAMRPCVLSLVISRRTLMDMFKTVMCKCLQRKHSNRQNGGTRKRSGTFSEI